MTEKIATEKEKRASGLSIIKEGSTIFADPKPTEGDISPRHAAITNLLVAAFVGQVPDEQTLTVLREGSKSASQRRTGPGGKVEVNLIEGFALPDGNEAAHEYVDGLVAEGRDVYSIWASVRSAYAQKD